MGTLDNPASRLYALLKRYRELADRNKPIVTTWQEVLEVPREDLVPALGQGAALVGEVGRRIMEGGLSGSIETYEHFREAWSAPFLYSGSPLGSTPSPGPELVDPGALAALGSVAALMSATRSDGQVPDSTTIEAFKTNLGEALDVLASDDSLDDLLRLAISQRLHDVLWALDHVRIGGPDAVAAAVERLLGQIVIHSTDNDRQNGVLRTVVGTCQTIWRAFKAGSQIGPALEGWDQVLSLPPGPG